MNNPYIIHLTYQTRQIDYLDPKENYITPCQKE